ncbi:MAG: N-methyl-L-tryptophan oxidase [Phycisphaera sp.]|nr:N-methyl-L-tryptophan oxidase [Phycisphaera sp.]
MTTAPIVVIGTGGIGAAVLAAIARRGAPVIGIDRFHPPHEHGSTHGGSRIIRTAYFEHADYVPLAREALDGWARLELETGRRCLHRCGVLLTGGPDSEALLGSISSAKSHGVMVEELDREALERRWPMFDLPSDHRGLFEPGGGLVVPEIGVSAHLEIARRHGAELVHGVEVEAIEEGATQSTVICHGRRIDASCVVVAAGAWTRKLLPEIAPASLSVHEKMMVWCDAVAGRSSEIQSPRLPAWLVDDGGGFGDGAYYGVPVHDGQTGPSGVKIGFHGPGIPIDPDQERGEPGMETLDRYHREVSRFLPGLLASPHAASSCLYTMSEDEDFVVDRVPGRPRVVVAAGFSGHGFKFAPVLGERIADMAIDGGHSPALAFLGMSRLDGFVGSKVKGNASARDGRE